MATQGTDRCRHLQRSCYTGVDKCTVNDNAAGFAGGGIYNSSGTLTVNNSTFSGNWAAAPYGRGIGGGIYNAKRGC